MSLLTKFISCSNRIEGVKFDDFHQVTKASIHPHRYHLWWTIKTKMYSDLWDIDGCCHYSESWSLLKRFCRKDFLQTQLHWIVLKIRAKNNQLKRDMNKRDKKIKKLKHKPTELVSEVLRVFIVIKESTKIETRMGEKHEAAGFIDFTSSYFYLFPVSKIIDR